MVEIRNYTKQKSHTKLSQTEESPTKMSSMDFMKICAIVWFWKAQLTSLEPTQVVSNNNRAKKRPILTWRHGLRI